MYCRTCGNKMNDNAEICVKCGVKRNVGKDYCQVCGSKTLETMINCKKCGAKLMKSMSTAQIQKKAVSKGKKTLGTVFLVIGLILVFATLANFLVGFTAGDSYSAMSSVSAGGRCAVLAGLFIGFGIRFRKKK